ncbi:hypothetical protein [Mangrovicoccus ximenensis]|uniref:hypothetical protein n=1 Tax=Mangrovicoccus ximenensis TaxID=1911570 RepID=UPI000D384E6E|nr:hypothetical protein [Mangrovicoccus ximenensis]
MPLAAAPVAFSLVSLSATGDVRGGAAMILAMTAASVLGAVPITRAGRRLAPLSCFRILVAVRVAALVAMTVAAVTGAAFGWLLVAALLLGSVHGAAHGILRSLLAGIVPGSGFPRALGIAATLNELVFVISPVLASLLGGASPAVALAAMTAAGPAGPGHPARPAARGAGAGKGTCSHAPGPVLAGRRRRWRLRRRGLRDRGRRAGAPLWA